MGIYGVQSSNINEIKNTGAPTLHIPKVFLMGHNITNLRKQFPHLKKNLLWSIFLSGCVQQGILIQRAFYHC
jgi:hypothetical protein